MAQGPAHWIWALIGLQSRLVKCLQQNRAFTMHTGDSRERGTQATRAAAQSPSSTHTTAACVRILTTVQGALKPSGDWKCPATGRFLIGRHGQQRKAR